MIVTAWYILKNKFDDVQYQRWIDNLLGVSESQIVVYTDLKSLHMLEKYRSKANIQFIVKELCEFKSYKYKDYWIKNHELNIYLNTRTSWELNMLWSEKIHFVAEVMEKYRPEWCIWCDIGYFRNRINDTPCTSKWPNFDTIQLLQQDKIHYGQVCNDSLLSQLQVYLSQRTSEGLPVRQVPPQICSVAGGFFIVHRSMIDLWHSLYYSRLELYFRNNYLVKDDQIILIDCILHQPNYFCLHKDRNTNCDNWFMFQRLLS
jgi:hypothetical protein